MLYPTFAHFVLPRSAYPGRRDIGFKITAGRADIIFCRGIHRHRLREHVEGILSIVCNALFGFVYLLVFKGDSHLRDDCHLMLL